MNRKEYIKSCEISEVRTISLDGIKQKISLEGKRKDLPLVLYLHGGPGTPLPMNVGTRGVSKDLTDRFILVCYDQLGSGINNYDLTNVSIADIIKMTKELLVYLKIQFPKNKIFIFGSSWGSYLSSNVASKDLVDGIVIWGQIIKDIHHNEVTFSALEKDLGSEKIEELRRKTKYTKEDLKLISNTISKKTDGLINSKGGKASLMPYFKAMLFNKDYHLKDVFAIFNNGYTKSQDFFDKVFKVDTTSLLNKVSVPYIILQGETDLVTPTKMVEDYLKNNPNPNISLKVIKNNAHIPSVSGMQEVVKELEKLNNL